jgi:hypothetical protein
MVGGVRSIAGLPEYESWSDTAKTFYEGKTLAPRGAGYVCLDKADVVIDGLRKNNASDVPQFEMLMNNPAEAVPCRIASSIDRY